MVIGNSTCLCTVLEWKSLPWMLIGLGSQGQLGGITKKAAHSARLETGTFVEKVHRYSRNNCSVLCTFCTNVPDWYTGIVWKQNLNQVVNWRSNFIESKDKSIICQIQRSDPFSFLAQRHQYSTFDVGLSMLNVQSFCCSDKALCFVTLIEKLALYLYIPIRFVRGAIKWTYLSLS